MKFNFENQSFWLSSEEQKGLTKEQIKEYYDSLLPSPLDKDESSARVELEATESILRSKLEIPPIYAIYKQLLYQSKPSKDKIFWITINPPSNIDVRKFINRVHSSTECPYMPNMRYTFEQRGETLDEMGKGLHVHILVDKKPKYSPKNIINNLSSFFKLDKPSIDVRVYPAHFRQDKIEYLSGNKDDKSKNLKLEIDKKFRAHYSLNTIY